MSFILKWLISALAMYVAISLIPGIYIIGGPFAAPLFAALIYASLGRPIKFILKLFSLPITIFTLGLFNFIINAMVLQLSSTLAVSLFGAGLQFASLGSAFFAALIVSLITSICDLT